MIIRSRNTFLIFRYLRITSLERCYYKTEMTEYPLQTSKVNTTEVLLNSLFF